MSVSSRWRKSVRHLDRGFVTDTLVVAIQELDGAPIVHSHEVEEMLLRRLFEKADAGLGSWTAYFTLLERLWPDKYGRTS